MNGKFITWSKVVSTVLVLYWLALFIGTHAPSHSTGSSHGTDKYAHFIAYAGLSFLVCWALTLRFWRMRHALAAALAVAALYGAFDELLQIPLVTREGDIWDWVADLGGATIGLASFALLHKLWPGRFRSMAKSTTAITIEPQSENQS